MSVEDWLVALCGAGMAAFMIAWLIINAVREKRG
jgi:hypothetical protein